MNIKKKILSGFLYSSLFKYSNLFNQFITTTILARILSPSDFGIVTVILVFLSFFYLISNFGFGPGIIQKQDIKDDEIFTIFLLTVLIGLFVSIFFTLIGPIIAEIYNEPDYNKITYLLSFSLFFHTVNMVPYNIALKKMKFKELGIRSFITSVLSSILAIILALKGFNYYALIYRSIFEAALIFLLNYNLSKIKLTMKINFQALKEITKYSSFQFLYNILDNLSKNIDSLLIGKYLGATNLGYYDRSYRLMSTIAGISPILTSVLHPVLSEHQGNLNLIFNVFIKVTKYLFFISFSLSIFLFFSSNEVILLLYGNKWILSIESFKYYSLLICSNIMIVGLVPFFQVYGKTSFLFILGFIYFFLIMISVFAGIFIFDSYNKVAFFIFLLISALVLPSYSFLGYAVFKKKIKYILFAFRPGLFLGFLIACSNLCYNYFVSISSIYLSFIIKLSIFLIIFLIFLKKLNYHKEITDFIKNKN